MTEATTLLERLDAAGRVGLDMSPGDPLAREAKAEIERLQACVKEREDALTTLLNVPELADIDPEDRSEETWDAERKARALLNSLAQPNTENAQG